MRDVPTLNIVTTNITVNSATTKGEFRNCQIFFIITPSSNVTGQGTRHLVAGTLDPLVGWVDLAL